MRPCVTLGLTGLVLVTGCQTFAPTPPKPETTPDSAQTGAVSTRAPAAAPQGPMFGPVPGPSGVTVSLPPRAAETNSTAQVKRPVPPHAAPNSKPALAESPKAEKTIPQPAIVTPDQSLRGKVTRFNETGRFMILEFPITHMPAKGKTVFLYRNGLKVGEAKVTGPQRDDRTVADLITGEAQPGDEVRDQ